MKAQAERSWTLGQGATAVNGGADVEGYDLRIDRLVRAH